MADREELERLRAAIPIVTDGRFDADSALEHLDMLQLDEPEVVVTDARPSLATNGDYWIDDAGELWKQVTFCAEATAALENVKTGERVGGACGAPIFDRFTHLVPETKAG